MANSLITRCPKCSTAFRVSDEALGMAKGKVRCGQCFHIFDAQKSTKEKQVQNRATQEAQPTPLSTPSTQDNATSHKTQSENRLAPTAQEGIVNPEWLHTLFNDDDLTSPNPTQPKADSADKSSASSAEAITTKSTAQKASARGNSKVEEPAPWEVELAEVEAALNATTKLPPSRKQAKVAPSSEKAKPPAPEPDYMVALHSLAQSASEQDRPDRENQHTILEQLSAQDSLAPLLEEPSPSKGAPLRWLWVLGTFIGLAILAGQAAGHFFDQGSRSANFRSIYQTICTYSGCQLPRFEDVSAITIQNVRVQSHPSLPNTLLVNAIITNTSPFSQPMPKIALEFFDLNGAPVAARLFSPSSYLHKDFLDITYMPPNTPIHLVIPIQDPGARAVTHQLRAFPTDTRSY